MIEVSKLGMPGIGLVVGGVVLAVLLASLPLHAQTSPVTAEVDKTDLEPTDVLTLTVTIVDQMTVSVPVLPYIDGLQIVSTRARSQRQSSGGRFSATFEFVYKFLPTRFGKIEIGPITVSIEDDVHTTEPISINVTQASPQPGLSQAPDGPARASVPSPQHHFSEAVVDNEHPYMGQQITYKLRFYSTDPPHRPTYRAPDFAGFWNAGQRPEVRYTTTVASRSYTVTEFDTILFPTLSGDIEIEPGLVSMLTGDFGSRRSDFRTARIELGVRPLPPNEPSGFKGAVGKYAISASTDLDSVVVGDPVTLSVVVSGAGNFNILPEPLWPEARGLRAFDNDTHLRTAVSNGKVTGAKTFERVIVPDIAGSLELPPIEYVYFDPELEQYVTVSSDPIPLEVVPDAGGQAPLPAPADAGDQPGQTIVLDIRHIKPTPKGLGSSVSPLTSSRLYWGVSTVPILGLLAVVGWNIVSRRRAARTESNRPATAGAFALARLSGLERGASAADAASLALHGYLGSVLRRPTSALPTRDLAALMRERGASAETAEQLASTLETLDRMRFAPPGLVEDEAIAHNVAEVVQKLVSELAR